MKNIIVKINELNFIIMNCHLITMKKMFQEVSNEGRKVKDNTQRKSPNVITKDHTHYKL